MNEHDYVLRDAAMAEFVDSYFKARPQLPRDRLNELLVEAGFKAAWKPAQSERLEKAEAELEKMRGHEREWSAQLCEWLPVGTGYEGKTFAEAIRGKGLGAKLAEWFIPSTFLKITAPVPAPAAPAVPEEWREALADMLSIIESAGIMNLANGVQLGQVSWSVKMTDACNYARALLQSAPQSEVRHD